MITPHFLVGLKAVESLLSVKFSEDAKRFLGEAYSFGPNPGVTTWRLIFAASNLGNETASSFLSRFAAAANAHRKDLQKLEQMPSPHQIEEITDLATSGKIISFAAQFVIERASKDTANKFGHFLEPEDLLRALAATKPASLALLNFNGRQFPALLDDWIAYASGDERAFEMPDPGTGSNFPKSHGEWSRYLQDRYGVSFSETATTLIIDAADKVRQFGAIDRSLVTTRDFVGPMVQSGGLLQGLKLSQFAGSSSKSEWNEDSSQRDSEMSAALSKGFPAFSGEVEAALIKANDLARATDFGSEVTDWHIGLAIIGSRAPGIQWHLRMGKSSCEEAFKVLLRNLQANNPMLYGARNWAATLQMGEPSFDDQPKMQVPQPEGPLLAVGSGINPGRYGKLCLGVEETAESIATLFRTAAKGIVLKVKGQQPKLRVSDFIFALYGEWGRGKSTLMEQVSKRLKTFPSKQETPRTGSGLKPAKCCCKWLRRRCLKIRKLLRALKRWFAGTAKEWFVDVFWGAPRVKASYATIKFSAWKYPSRPEVWVHLYERIREAAEGVSLLQRMRISFRIGLLESGWLPLVCGFILLTLSRLPLWDWAHGIWTAVGWLGFILIAGFYFRASKIAAVIGQRYVSAPDHADKLGLQAVIGRDLKNLLRSWIFPPIQEDDEIAVEKMRSIDLSFGKKGWRLLVLLACLVLMSYCLTRNAIQKAYCEQQDAYSKALEKWSKPPRSPAFLDNLLWPGKAGMLNGSAQDLSVSNTPKPVKPSDPRWIYIELNCAGILTLSLGWIISRLPLRYERLLLTVDDLDRCEPSQMVAVIESLRLFLDDEAMSHRVQMAMLMDRKLLEATLKRKAVKERNRENPDRYVKTQREKLFMCELEMPHLSNKDRDELLGELFPPPKSPANPIQEPPAPVAAEVSQGNSGTLHRQPTPAEQAETSVNVVNDARLVPIIEEDITEQERSILVDAIRQVSGNLLTPRSLMMLRIRFQLVRLLLIQEKKHNQLTERMLTGVASRLIKSFYPESSVALSTVDPDIDRIIAYVAFDSDASAVEKT